MSFKILDKKNEKQATCFLCKVPLSEFMYSLPSDYRTFEVQRGIVSNKYLDGMIDTFLSCSHIPTMVLIAEDIDSNNKELRLHEFRILDGLQRTYRLRVIWDTVQLISDSKCYRGNENSLSLARKFSSELSKVGCSSKVFKKLIDAFRDNGPNYVNSLFEKVDLWVEVWIGLSQDEQVEKMLLLNAGHKTVNIKHQLEILFFHVIESIREAAPSHIEIYKTRELSAASYSKNRKVHEYHYSHIISALVSLSLGRTVNTNSDFIRSIQEDEIKVYELSDGIDISLIELFLKCLISLDESLYSKYQETGVRWIGREVALIGLFGALGSYARSNNFSIKESLNYLIEKAQEISNVLNLEAFEESRNKAQLAKVNIGNLNKKAIYRAALDFLNEQENSSINWDFYFYEKEGSK